MVGTLIIWFSVATLVLFLFLLCLCIGGVLGAFKLITPFLIKCLSKDHDQMYTKGQPINNQCFICLQRISNEVVATCNHSFCGVCISNYIQSNENGQINCPACRKQILVLFRRFQSVTDEQNKLKQFISSYNYKCTRQPNILRAISEFGNTLRNLPLLLSSSGLSYLLGDSRLKYVIFLAIYTLCPFDLLPQGILGPIGLLDDGIVLAGLIRQISSILYGFVREQMNRP